MDHYMKGEVRVLEDLNPYEAGFKDAIHMKVSNGSKIKNLMAYALKKMKEPNVNHITWTGSGNGVTKTVSCAEIMKKKVQNLYQATNIRKKRTEEYWEPNMEGLERLRVNRDEPAITILLSKESLDTTMLGYQPPGVLETFWKRASTEESEGKPETMLTKKTGVTYSRSSGNMDPPGMERRRKRKPQSGLDRKDTQNSKRRGQDTTKKAANSEKPSIVDNMPSENNTSISGRTDSQAPR